MYFLNTPVGTQFVVKTDWVHNWFSFTFFRRWVLVAGACLGGINLRRLGLLLCHTCIYKFLRLQAFASKKKGCSTFAAKTGPLVWLTVGRCSSDWQAVYVSAILRTMTGHQAIRQPTWQTSDASHFTYFDSPSGHVTWLAPFYVLFWTWLSQNRFAQWNVQQEKISPDYHTLSQDFRDVPFIKINRGKQIMKYKLPLATIKALNKEGGIFLLSRQLTHFPKRETR